MRYFLLPILVAGLVQISLAKGGGSSGGGGRGGGGSNSSYFICKTTCSSNFAFMYGQAYASMYTYVEAIVQASLNIFWLLVLVGFFLRLRKVEAFSIRSAMVMFMISLVFLFVRYILLATEALVLSWYRFESTIALMFWRIGFSLLLIAISRQIDLEGITSTMNILSQFLLGILNITYVSLDFKISDRAVDSFHDVKDWRLSDRDFGLTLSADGIHALVTSDGNLNALTPQYIQNKMMNVVSKGFQHDRVGHLRLGMVIDLLSLMIATLLFTRAVLQILKWKPLSVNCPYLFFTATSGLFLSTLFRFVITTAYVLHNWGVVTNIAKWNAWMKTYQSLDVAKGIFPASTFLKGYRVTATGFPIIQAVIESFGIVVACAAIACAKKIQSKTVAEDETSAAEEASVEEEASMENEAMVENKELVDKEASEKVVPVKDKLSEVKAKV